MRTDEQLLTVLRDPNSSADDKRAALAELYLRHLTTALTTAQAVLHNTPLDPQDIAQEVFIERFSAIVRGYSPEGGSFPTYLRRCVFNAAISARRRLRPQARLNAGHDQLFSTDTPAPPDVLINEREADDLLGCLPDLVRAIVRAHYLGDQSADEIATEHGLEVAQVYRLLHQGRQLIRRQMAIRQVLDPDETLSPRREAELFAALRDLARARKAEPITRLAAAGDGRAIQTLKPSAKGVILDSLTGFLDWQQDRGELWSLQLRFWSRNSPGAEGNDPDVLRRLHRLRVRIEWRAKGKTPESADVELRLDSDENLVSTPARFAVGTPLPGARVKLLPLGRGSAPA